MGRKGERDIIDVEGDEMEREMERETSLMQREMRWRVR